MLCDVISKDIKKLKRLRNISVIKANDLKQTIKVNNNRGIFKAIKQLITGVFTTANLLHKHSK